MAQDFCCPVCDRHGLAPDCECCPQCDADLTCFQDLDRLRTESASPGTKKRVEDISPNHFTRISMFTCVFSGVIALAILSFTMGRFDRRLAGMDKTIAIAIHNKGLQQAMSTARLHINELKISHENSIFRIEKAVKGNAIEIEHTGSRVTSLEEELNKHIAAVLSKEINRISVIPPAAVSAITTPPFSDNAFLYYTRKTDTLWAISRRFYGDGKYYPLIMEQNPHLDISNITVGREIRLISDPDPRMLADMYRRKTEWKNGMLLWRHNVQPEETRDSIYTRFSAPGAPGQVFFDSGEKIVPFNTIKIILQ